MVGYVQLGRESPFEAGQQALFDVFQFHGRFVRRQDQLLAGQLQVVEYVEEGVLRSRLARQFLDVVDDQYVDHLVEMDEVGYFAVFVGRLELGLELVHRYIEHLQFRMALAYFMTYGLYDVGLAQSRVTIYI